MRALLLQGIAALVLTMFLAASSGHTALAAAPAPASAPPADRPSTAEREQSSDLVFSLGELTAVDARSITLTFDGGHTEAYRLTQGTTISRRRTATLRRCRILISAR